MKLNWKVTSGKRVAIYNGFRYTVMGAGKRNHYNIFVDGNYTRTIEGLEAAKRHCEHTAVKYDDMEASS